MMMHIVDLDARRIRARDIARNFDREASAKIAKGRSCSNTHNKEN
jgi:hypothetical protein